MDADRQPESVAFERYLLRPSRRRLARLVRDYHGYVWSTALRFTDNEDDAADLMQDLFLSLLTRPPRPEDVRSPRGYLAYRVLTLATRAERSRERRRRREAQSVEKLAREAGAGVADAGVDVEAVREAIRALPERVRTAVEYRYFGDLKNREIAELLGVSERTVEDDLRDGRESLRGRLGAGALGALALMGGGELLPAPRGVLEVLLRIARRGSAFVAAEAPRAGRGFLRGKASALAAALICLATLAGWVAFRPGGAPTRIAAPPAVDTVRTPGQREIPLATPGKPAETPTVAAGPPPILEAPPLFPISGWVVDEGGSPLQGAAVKVYVCPSGGLQTEGNIGDVWLIGETSSGEDGVFQVAIPPPAKGSLTLTAEDDAGRRGWCHADGVYFAPTMRPSPPECVVIALRPCDAVLRGRVLDAEGLPIAGATVWALVRCGVLETPILQDAATIGPGQVTTDERGRFAFEALPATSPLDIVAEHPLHLSKRLRHVMAGPEPLEIRLVAGTSFVGRVVDGSGEPVAGAVVSLRTDNRDDFPTWLPNRRYQKTAGDGAFDLVGVAFGWSILTVHAPERFLPIPEERIEVTGPVEGRRIVLGAEAWLRGTALERVSGKPIARVEVMVRSGELGRYITAGDDGSFWCAVLPGEVKVLPEGNAALGWEPDGEGFEGKVKAGETLAGADVGFRKTPVKAAPEAKDTSIRGTVLGPEGKPVLAMVALVPRDGPHGFNHSLSESTSGVDGKFILFRRARAPACLIACIPSRRLRGEVRVEEASEDEVEVVLEPYAPLRIEGQVLTSMPPVGVPVAGAGIIIARSTADMQGPVRSIRADRDGRFVLDDLAPDTHYGFNAVVGDAHGPRSWAQARPGETVHVEVYFTPPADVLEGRVTDDQGEPLAGLAVDYDYWDDDTIRFQRTLTGADGGFHVAGVPNGTYQLVIDERGWKVWGEQVKTEDRPFQIVLSRTRRIRLDLQDSAGRPVRSHATGVRLGGEHGSIVRLVGDGGHLTAEVPEAEQSITICDPAGRAVLPEIDLEWPPEGALDLGTIVLDPE